MNGFLSLNFLIRKMGTIIPVPSLTLDCYEVLVKLRRSCVLLPQHVRTGIQENVEQLKDWPDGTILLLEWPRFRAAGTPHWPGQGRRGCDTTRWATTAATETVPVTPGATRPAPAQHGGDLGSSCRGAGCQQQAKFTNITTLIPKRITGWVPHSQPHNHSPQLQSQTHMVSHVATCVHTHPCGLRDSQLHTPGSRAATQSRTHRGSHTVSHTARPTIPHALHSRAHLQPLARSPPGAPRACPPTHTHASPTTG